MSSAAAPQAAIVDAVVGGQVDLAFAWGPTAGYFARRARVPLTVAPLRVQADGPALPMASDISMGLRREDRALKREIDAALTRRADDIRAVLKSYGVPLVE